MTLPITSGVNLIGIYGRAGAGKDTTADFLIDTYKAHYKQAFADPLKQVASEAFGIPLDNFYDQSLKEQEIEYWGTTSRKIAQFLGTEMFRETINSLIPVGPNFWIRRAAARINNLYVPDDEGEYEEGDTVVIPDVRFQNEYDWIIENNGIIIHLTRPGADGNIGIPNHASEQSINLHCKERTYLCSNDGTIPQLHIKVANIIISTKY